MLLEFRSGFAGLKEGFEALGHVVVGNRGSEYTTGNAELCIADFVDCARNLRRTLSTARRLRAARVPFIALNRDAPWHRGVHRTRLAMLAAAKPFDGYAAHSMQDAGRFSGRTLYCPNAARESVYRATHDELAAMREPAWFRWDVSFFGNLDVARYPEHKRRAEFFRSLQERLQPLGARTLFRDAAAMPVAEQLEVVRRSRISLSAIAACDSGREPSWGLPERCYGVPACGGFLLSDRRRHAPEDFADDERAEFDTLDDCVALIREYLAHHERARGIAERAHARVMRDHLYRHRAMRLIDFAGNVRRV